MILIFVPITVRCIFSLLILPTSCKHNKFTLQYNINKYMYNLSKPSHSGTEEFVQFRQVFGLHRFKLHRHLVDGTVKSVWFLQDFGFLWVQFRQVSLYYSTTCQNQTSVGPTCVFGIGRCLVYSG